LIFTVYDDDSEFGTNIGITTIFQKTDFCKSANKSSLAVPVCKTILSDFTSVVVKTTFTSTGRTNSFVATKSEVDKIIEPADSSKLLQAIPVFLGGIVSRIQLTSVYPGLLHPVLWPMTKDKASLHPNLFDKGLEILIGNIIKGSIYRSFFAKSAMCSASTNALTSFTLQSTVLGNQFGTVFSIVQLVFQIIALAMALFHLSSKSIIAPGIWFAQDSKYFAAMLYKSPIMDVGCSKNVTDEEIWQFLDVYARVGEARETADDYEYGTCVVRLPEQVVPFQEGKSYQ
jgi:hypothetical protein